MKWVLTTVIVLAAMSGAADSQGTTQMSGDQPVHPGTAVLDRMGIFAGNPGPQALLGSETPPGVRSTEVGKTVKKQ